MKSNHTKETWLRQKRTIYCLHEVPRAFDKNGNPMLCNKYFASIQPDYGRGITEEMAEEQAKFIHTAINLHDELVEALKGLYEFNLNGTGYLDQLLNGAESILLKTKTIIP